MSWWTTDQVAEYLGVSAQAIYDSRARDRFPGNRGKRQGRSLRFPSEAIEAGRRAVEEGRDPDAAETTNDGTEAILWALSGIHTTLRAIENEIRAHGELDRQLARHLLAPTMTLTTGDDEDE